jgi:hypothetical protein
MQKSQTFKSINKKLISIDIDCYKPANGETITIKTKPFVPASLSVELLKSAKSTRNCILKNQFRNLDHFI